MFHTYTVFITQSIVPRPLHYDKYLDLSCKSHTLAQTMINVLYIICSTSKMHMRSTEHQHDQGEALFANVEMGVGIFFKIAIVFFLSVRYNRTAYIAG